MLKLCFIELTLYAIECQVTASTVINLWVLFKRAVSIVTNNHSSKIFYHEIVVFIARKWGGGRRGGRRRLNTKPLWGSCFHCPKKL
jgi:hypothetical protein